MAFTAKDKVALSLALVLGSAFGHFSILAGYGGVLIGGFYGILIVPLVVIFLADQRKVLVWQASIVPFALCVFFENGGVDVRALFMFWAMGTVISSPVPIFLYWRRSRGRARHQSMWLFLGMAFVSIVGSVWRDPFLFLGLILLWTVLCLATFAWEWHTSVEPAGPKRATLAATFVLVLAISTLGLTAVFLKQQAFRSAINHRYPRIARLFVAIGADPNGRDAFGQVALVDGAWIGDLGGVNALISMGANVNQEQEGSLHGMLPSGTALSVAAATGRTAICESLLDAGADVNKRNRKGATPLLVALSRGSLACVPTLLDHGADVNASDLQGRAALMFLMTFAPDDPAAQSILGELLAKGADVNVKDADGKTAEDWAMSNRHDRFAEQLRILRKTKPDR
jgi:hypothetical protein